MARPGPLELFFALKRLFGPIGPIFRAGWTVKILIRKNRANFGPVRFWPDPLLIRPSPPRPARLSPLVMGAQFCFFKKRKIKNKMKRKASLEKIKNKAKFNFLFKSKATLTGNYFLFLYPFSFTIGSNMSGRGCHVESTR